MVEFLREMAAASAARVEEARRREPAKSLMVRALQAPTPRPLRFHPSGFDLIAEIKLRSPSAGALAPSAAGTVDAIANRAREYERGRAVALSVLTEPTRFGGSPAHLERVAQAVSSPVMRKDFLVDPYQVLEARAMGASGVLVIVRLVNDAVLERMVAAARELELFVLLEAFNLEGVRRVERFLKREDTGGVILVGVNSRDLATLAVDQGRLARLVPALPAGVPRVAESGIDGTAGLQRVAQAGYDVALIGAALMRAPDPADTIATWLDFGRKVRRSACASG